MIKRGFGYVAILIVVLIIGYIVYQKQFTFIDTNDEYKEESKSDFKGKTLILVAEEKNITGRKKGFGTLSDNLSFWKIKDDKVLLREENLMPNQDTSVLFIYTRDNNTFENQSNIIPVSNFPYNAYQNETSFKILKVKEDGSAILEIQDKKIKLDPGQTFRDVWLNDFQLRNIKLKNEGFFDYDKFELFEDSSKDTKKKDKTS